MLLRLGMHGAVAAQAMLRCRTVLQAFAAELGIVRLNVVLEPDQPLVRGRSGKVCRVMTNCA